MTELVPVSRGELAEADPVVVVADPVGTYLRGLGPSSQNTMRQRLDRLAQLLTGNDDAVAESVPWHTVRPDRTSELAAIVRAAYAPSTAKQALSALRGVLRQCWRLELIDRDAYERAIDWGRDRGETLQGALAGRHVAPGEIGALFAWCATDPVPARGARDAALLALLYGAGLRRAEAVALDLEHFDPETGTTTVHGKGNKIRLAYCQGGGCEAVAAWIELRGSEPGPLLLAVNKGGRIDPKRRRMTTQAVYYVLQRLAKRARVARFAPHDLRRTFAGDLFDAGADTAAVQRLMGHASSSTTTSYDRRGEQAKQRAASLIHVPYVAPQE